MSFRVEYGPMNGLKYAFGKLIPRDKIQPPLEHALIVDKYMEIFVPYSYLTCFWHNKNITNKITVGIVT